MAQDRTPLKLAIAGFGAIGLTVARYVDEGRIAGMKVTAVSARDTGKAIGNMAEFRSKPQILPLHQLADVADIILECTPAAVFEQSARPTVEQGKIFVPLSVGALLNHMDLIERAKETGAKIMVPTGALLGLDAIKAISQGTVHSIRLITRKPPRGLKGAPYLIDHDISLDDIEEAIKVFSGSAREAAKGFPANVNVAAALALAGVGPDATQVEIWADPTLSRNTHTITAKSDSSDLSMTIENIPTEETPATGKITALSAIAMLKRLTDPLIVGT